MFKSLFKNHTFLTNTLTGSGLFIIGDYIEQKIEQKRGLSNALDRGRVARTALVGLIQGPPHIYFYKILEKKFPQKDLKTIGKKILLDQAIACPMFSVLYFVPMGLLEGRGWGRSWSEFFEKFPFVYLVDWLLWPMCQFVNFLWVPACYRVLYVNTATVGWNVFLSYMKHL